MNSPSSDGAVAGNEAGPLVLVVDDHAANRALLVDPLERRSYRVAQADCGSEALRLARVLRPDLMLLDVKMPDIDGFEVCRELRADSSFHAMPIVMVTSLFTSQEGKAERVRGLDAGADDFLGKPPIEAELFARVRSLLRVKSLHDQVQRQRDELAHSAGRLAAQVEAQSLENERLSRLKRFFSPALALRLLGSTDLDPWASHRREISVLFADLRGFTAFADSADPQTLMAVLAEFHAATGEAIHAHAGTLERFTGDGFMVFFNDPLPQADHSQRAMSLAEELQRRAAVLEAEWRSRGFRLGLGLGLARGMATLGGIGTEARMDYAAIGNVTNRAARLCAEAREGEIVVCRSVWGSLAPEQQALRGGREAELVLKGLPQPVAVVRLPGACAPAAPGSPG